jgi:hypothetical protein
VTGESRASIVPPERLSGVEHKAMIKPSSEAIHHKPVFQTVHITDLEHKDIKKP